MEDNILGQIEYYDKETLTLTVGIWDYSITEIPDGDSTLVQEAKDVVLNNMSMHKLVNDLDIAKDLIFLAYNGLIESELAVNVSDRQIRLSELVGDTNAFINTIESETKKALRTLTSAFDMLLDGEDKEAVREIKDVSQIAAKIAIKCDELAERYFKFAEEVREDSNFVQKARAKVKKEKDELEKALNKLNANLAKQQKIEADLREATQEIMEEIAEAKAEAADESTKAFLLEFFGGLFKAAGAALGAYVESQNPAAMLGKAVGKVTQVSEAAKKADNKAPQVEKKLEDFKEKFDEKSKKKEKLNKVEDELLEAEEQLDKAEEEQDSLEESNGADSSDKVTQARELADKKKKEKDSIQNDFDNILKEWDSIQKDLDKALNEIEFLPTEVNSNIKQLKEAAADQEEKEKEVDEARDEIKDLNAEVKKLKAQQISLTKKQKKGTISDAEKAELEKINKKLESLEKDKSNATEKKSEKTKELKSAEQLWQEKKGLMKAVQAGLSELGNTMNSLATKAESRATSARKLYIELCQEKRKFQAQRREAAANAVELVALISGNTSEQDKADNTMASYTIALWALRNLMLILKEAGTFWTNMGIAFKALENQEMVATLYKKISSTKKKKRKKYYREEKFNRQGIDLLVRWKALNEIAKSYKEETLELQDKVQKNIGAEQSYTVALAGLEKRKSDILKRLEDSRTGATHEEKKVEQEAAEIGIELPAVSESN